MRIEDVLSRLEGVQRRGEGKYQCKCPAHMDNVASLSVTDKGGKVLLHCHAGCDTADILASMGLSWADIGVRVPTAQQAFGGKEWIQQIENWKGRKVVAHYDYYNAAGGYLYTKVRLEGKNMLLGVLNEDKTYFKAGLKGINRTLFNLPALVRAVKAGDTVYYVEGEKDVLTMADIGLAATTAGSVSDWKREYAEHFRGANVVILPDNDKPGHDLAKRVQGDLQGVAASVKVVSTSKAEHGDITDWLNEGHSKEDLLKLVEGCNGESVIGAIKANSLISKTFSPLLEYVSGLIVEGLNLLVGASKIGKSWFSLQLAVCVALATSFLNKRTTKSSVLYLALEDSQRRLQSRLHKIGVTKENAPENLTFWTKARLVGEGLEDDLEQWIQENPQPYMIIIDTLQKVRGSSDKADNAYQADYKFMGKIKAIADAHKAAIICVHHTNKIKKAEDIFDKVSGSTGIIGTADTTMLIERERGAPTAILRFVGRDVWGDDLLIRFEGCRWHLVSENGEEYKARLEYQSSAVVTLIKSILEEHPGGGKWQYRELKEYSLKKMGYPLFVDGKDFVTKIKPVLAMLEVYDGIRVITGVTMTKNKVNAKGFTIENLITSKEIGDTEQLKIGAEVQNNTGG